MLRAPLDAEKTLFLLLLIASIVPIWTVHRLPTSDGPAHVANAFVLQHYNDPAYPEFGRYYELNRPVPNYLTHLILAGFMYFSSPTTAEKLLVTLYVVLLPIAARSALKSVDRRSAFLSILIFPFIYNLLLHDGMYNFSFGLAMFFAVVAYLLNRPQGLSLWQTAALSGLFTITYFSHMVPFVLVLVVSGIVQLGRWWTEAAQSRRWFASAVRHLGPLALALVPTLVFASMYLSARRNRPGFTIGIVDRLVQLATCYSLVSFSRWEVLLSIPVAVTFGVIAVVLVRRRPEAAAGSSLLAAAGASTALYLLTPNGVGAGAYISERLLLLVYFCFLLWFGSHYFTKSARRAIQTTAAVITLAMLVQHTIKYRELNRYIDEYLMVSTSIGPNTTVFPIIYSYNGRASDGSELSRRVWPFANLSSWIAAERGVVDLHNYEAWTGEFPLLFRDDLNPARHLCREILAPPSDVNFMGYSARSRGEVRYVVVWDSRGHEAEPRSQAITSQLQQSYELIDTSKPNGFARLYRLRGRSL